PSSLTLKPSHTNASTQRSNPRPLTRLPNTSTRNTPTVVPNTSTLHVNPAL
ncbi:hypothetical protein C8Q76DRAFT_633181, partial [Earliella scabrosa]